MLEKEEEIAFSLRGLEEQLQQYRPSLPLLPSPTFFVAPQDSTALLPGPSVSKPAHHWPGPTSLPRGADVC